eukprot:m.8957 g.8957  ORF g.8957 m.8957 type:complete len:215 (+) comp3983_c0_seq1:131-775(+)
MAAISALLLVFVGILQIPTSEASCSYDRVRYWFVVRLDGCCQNDEASKFRVSNQGECEAECNSKPSCTGYTFYEIRSDEDYCILHDTAITKSKGCVAFVKHNCNKKKSCGATPVATTKKVITTTNEITTTKGVGTTIAVTTVKPTKPTTNSATTFSGTENSKTDSNVKSSMTTLGKTGNNTSTLSMSTSMATSTVSSQANTNNGNGNSSNNNNN